MGGKNSTEQGLNGFEKHTLDIAVMGVWGAGKSSLINALWGLSDFDESTEKICVAQTTRETMFYPHPIFPDVRIWDLPGIGTPGIEEKDYLQKVKDSQFDFFIVVACHCFTSYDIQLSRTIQKMGKRFYYVLSKMDVSMKHEKWRPDFNEEAALQQVRTYCLSNCRGAGISSPEIFIVSILCPDKYDFPLLQRTLENEIRALRGRILRPAVLQDSEKRSRTRSTDSLRRAMGGKCLTLVGSNEEKSASEERNLSYPTLSGKTTLDIAITGLSGAGKSSLVNALRGLSDFDEWAAKTDVIEGTTEPMPYPHPTFPDVTIWDLPGIGTPNFKAEEYLERVNYSHYDFFIIVASDRFTVYDRQLSHAVQKMKKQLYYVWSKMDASINNAKLNPAFNEEATLQKVRTYCLDNLVEAGISSPQIFLISSWYWEKYDFPLLQMTLENEIEALRRRILRPTVLPDSEKKRDD